MSVSVVVPYRGDNGGPRDQAWDYVQEWWEKNHPSWQVVSGHLIPEERWVKAHAVADGLLDAKGDILVIADADVLAPGVGAAVDAVVHGSARWAVPHYRVHRLTEQATAGILAGGPLPADPGPNRMPPRGTVLESHRGMVGGGMVVLERRLYDRAPLDSRFVGFGQEDASWGIALSALGGKPYRGVAPLWHLWHPPQPRLTRAIGSHESLELYKRYRRANGSPNLVNALLAEMSE